jgi:hypothetical protein
MQRNTHARNDDQRRGAQVRNAAFELQVGERGEEEEDA